MKAVKLLALAAVLALLAAFATSNTLSGPFQDNQSCSISKARAASILFEPVTQWQIYNDADYGLLLEYPVGWESNTTIFQAIPYADPSAIIKRQTFMGPEGMVDLDLWLANGRSLEEWSVWQGKTRSPFPVSKSNAKVWGKPAIVFIEKGGTVDMLTALFSDGKYIYRLWYTIMRNGVGLQVYRHMLNTFELPQPSDKKAVPAELPEQVWKTVESAVEESGIISPLSSPCCGYYASSNPFPCCDNKGNCTWWVYYKYGYVPFRGDAGTWYGQVPNYPDWARGGAPRRNQENIVWWSASQKPSYGHVAYAANYTGGTNITVSEMLWCTSCGRTKSYAITNPGGYIYEKYPPQP